MKSGTVFFSMEASFFSQDLHVKPCRDLATVDFIGLSVLPGDRGHRQITQNRPYQKIICCEKLVAVKVA
jgi:hypothetical protein